MQVFLCSCKDLINVHQCFFHADCPHSTGGKWKCDHALASLLSDLFMFAGFRVETSDIRARAESCVFSVTNRETFRSVMRNQVVSINIPKLITKVWWLFVIGASIGLVCMLWPLL
jgi:hypothetical protein